MSKITTIGIPTGGDKDYILKKKSATNYDVEWSAATPGGGGTGTVTSITAGTGLSGGTITASGTISHADTSSQTSVDNSNGTVIQDITLDTFGHVTALGSYNLDLRYYTETEVDSLLTGYVPNTRSITINGTSYDLSANRTWSVGTVTSVGITAGTGISISGSPITGSGSITVTNSAPDQTVSLTAGSGISISGTYPSFTITNTGSSGITGSGTSGYVTYWNGASSITGESNLFWDATNDRLGIKQASPSYNLDVNGTGRFSGQLTMAYGGNPRLILNDTDAGSGNVGILFQENSADKWSLASAGGNIQLFDEVNAVQRLLLTSSGNLGLGVTPSAWRNIDKVIQINNGSIYDENGINFWVGQNYFENSSGNYIYLANSGASAYRQYNGGHYWLTAPSGTAGNTISFTQAMTLDSSGRLGIGSTTPANALTVDGISNAAKISIERDTVGVSTIIGYLDFTNNNSGTTYGRVLGGRNAAGDGYVALGTGVSTNLYALESGNVGINTTTPDDKLDVNGGNSGAATFRNTYFFGNDNYAIRIVGDTTKYGYISQYVNDGNLVLASGMRYYGAGPWTPDSTNAESIQLYNGDIYFTTNAGLTSGVNFTPSERLRITSGGNVGIGVTTPSRLLHLHTPSTDPTYLQLSNTTSGIGTGDGLQIAFTGTNASIINREAGYLQFETSDTPRMYIASGGNVGINETSPSFKLHINSGTDGTMLFANSTRLGGGGISFANNGSVRLYLGQANWLGLDGINTSNTSIALAAAQTADIIFATNAANVTNGEKMRITSGGNVGINTTSPSAKLVVEDGVANQTGAPTYRGSMIISNGGGSTSTSGGLEFHAASSGSGYGWRVSTPDLGSGNIPVSYQSRTNNASWTERLRLNTSGQLQLNNYTSTTSFTGTVTGLLAFDSSGNVLTKAVSGSDTYETGTWTPTLEVQSPNTNFTSVSYDSIRAGYYTKIGNIVYIHGVMRTDSVLKGSASNSAPVVIGGLPFTNDKDVNVSITYTNAVDAAQVVSGNYDGQSTYFVLYRVSSTTAHIAVTVSDIRTGADSNLYRFFGFYKV